MARSLKQQRADFERVNFESKTIKQATKILKEKYMALGRKIPKKLEAGNARKKDIARYQQTIRNAFDRKIINTDMRKSNKVTKMYKSLARVQKQRKNVVTGMLQGYDESFIKGFLKGKKAALGKNISYEISPTVLPSLIDVHNLAEMNGISPLQWLKNEVKALKKDLNNLKTADDNSKNTEYIMKEIKNLIEIEGLTFTEDNERKIKAKLNTLDFLGVQKLSSIISTKVGNAFYEKYKLGLTMFDNRELVDGVLSDISKAKKSKLVDYVRLIE